ncbi:MAG TPA: outer membrane channel superfamily protein [Flavobacteriaceae bacterium]|nr:outer membrane channel superfamily protein [Flavobacteriaceae bacterium]MAM29375.1 outer membrane channel superfamily protein [Flavobacteriaceae bacterium]HBR53763.1 outer membrane channel superfamily protein [Flavobacteriaceae bacterium]HIB48012.1 PorT family protein [Flavobacteriaceae bacterium]|tara:strand:- start:29 stop:586 length:558 start_codon:yes stop_codon:yes gene_type:complete
MKKVFLVCALVFMAANVSAQGIDFGVKAGVNFASISDAQGLDLSNRTGIVVGAFVGGKFSDRFGIQADLLYSQQGAEFDAGEFNLDYVNVPIVAKIYLVKGFHVQAGPQFGVVVNDDTQTVIGEVINDIAVNDFDVSGVVGLGYDVPLGLRLEGRYNFGFSDVPEAPGSSGKNSVVTLSVGYSFL